MSRLPTVGGDSNAWGTVLNDYLGVAHNADGTQKDAPFNVLSFGATGDGSTDDTTAIQDALDAAEANRGTVLIPASDTEYMFSNLKIGHYVKLVGQGMGSTILKRIGGSTGHAIREKTAGEGNSSGASTIGLRDFTVQGNSTSGNGIDLGNQGGAQFTSGSTLQNVWVQDFTSGIGFNINSNAEAFAYLWAVQCQDGFNFQGGGANQMFAMYAERNTRYQLHIQEPWSHFFGTQIESNVSDTNPFIRVTGAGNTFDGIYMSYVGAATKPALILNVTGANNNMYRDVQMTGSGVYTHGIKHEAFSGGTGTDTRIHQYEIGLASGTSSWYVNGSNGDTMYRSGSVETSIARAEEVVGLTYGTTIATDASRGTIFRITATNGTGFTISNPTNPTTGQIITYEIRNSSGGTMGAITWGSNFKLGGSLTNPATGKRKTISFWYDSSAWMQMNAVSADVDI